jgi:hypothetical protein
MGTERQRELRRRRTRSKKKAVYERRAAKASVSEKVVLANKIRRLTPGAEQIVARLGLGER